MYARVHRTIQALVESSGVGVLATIASSSNSDIAEVEVCLALLSTLSSISDKARQGLFDMGGTSMLLDCVKQQPVSWHEYEHVGGAYARRGGIYLCRVDCLLVV
jgi:hypothetical protein